MHRLAGIMLLISSVAHAQGLVRVDPSSPSLVVTTPAGITRVQVETDGVLHITHAKEAAHLEHPSFIMDEARKKAGSGMVEETTLLTKDLSARVDPATGAITFLDRATNRPILAELPNGFSMEPAEVQGEQTFHVRQQWAGASGEGLYGLGQHQYGVTNIKNLDIELWQHNTEIAVPLLVSSKGYGILWDNPSYTRFGDPRDFAPIPADHLFDATGAAGGFTATAFRDAAMTQQSAQRVDAAISNGRVGVGGGRGRGPAEQAIRWEGKVLADTSGLYQFQLYANGGSRMWIDDMLVADHWRQNWLPWSDLLPVRFDAGTRHKLKVEWVKDGGAYCSLTWKPPTPGTTPADRPTSLWSQVGENVDYYFIYGGKNPGALDRVLAGYRHLTGPAPMMPIWAFGLWQSRQRYETQKASLDVVRGFRDRHIPFDVIVQDWMYWRQDDWGSHQFDAARFPEPDQWVKDIHALNARVMISVWGKFYPTTDNARALADKGYLYPVNPGERDWVGRGFPYAFYDAFNPGARQMFWQQVNDRLFSKGFDAWWMDATEPDLTQPSPPTLDRQLADMEKTAAGTGARVLNAYPLLNTRAVYEGQRQAAPGQRVFILTRSGYAGQQHYAGAVWSGDISSTWTAMKKQIAAGLGCSISGLPYWTMDCGGFSVPAKFSSRNATPEAVDEWRELNARWFEFATFVPLLRVHGESPPREMWEFGGENTETYRAILKFDRLRYRLLPYVYSVAGEVTQNGGTFMRPLAMDFPDDPRSNNIADQYMFGPAFLVSPVTSYKSPVCRVELPIADGGWYRFWSGEHHGRVGEGLPSDLVPAPLDEIPLHIRAGSIIPFGPERQYTTEKKADPLTLFVYTGADGHLTLYEDDGLTYQYEKGAFARIPLTWNQATQTLTIGRREGSFNGMLDKRTIQVVFITASRPVPFSFDPRPDKAIPYTGEMIEVHP